jgi:hypothetical protein
LFIREVRETLLQAIPARGRFLTARKPDRCQHNDDHDGSSRENSERRSAPRSKWREELSNPNQAEEQRLQNTKRRETRGTAGDRPTKTGHGTTPGKQTFEGLNDLPMKTQGGTMELANKEVRLTGVTSRGRVWLAPLGGRDAANTFGIPLFPLNQD